MKALRNYLDKIKPNFEEGGKFHAFRSVFDGFETFLFVPNATSKSGTHIHDSIDSKRIMSMVVIALVPALLFGMYNVGYQHFHATGAAGGFWEMFIYGFLAVLPKIIVSFAQDCGELRGGTRHRVRGGSVEGRGDSGRFPGFRYLDSDDCSGRLPAVDSGGGYCIFCNFC